MDGLPEPSPELVIIGAGLVELEIALRELGLKKPDFAERVLNRVASEAMKSAVVRLRGPKMSPASLDAIAEAETWLGQATIVVKAMRRA